jgi:VWFA-related protein
MKLWRLLGVMVTLGLALWAFAQDPVPAAKQPVSEPGTDLTRIQVDVTRVNMLFTVTDKRGRFVTSLTKEDFEVLDRKKPQVIQEFMAEADLPLRLAVLVDTSNSIRDRFRFEQEAASEFVKSVLKSNADKAMIVSFDTQAELVSDMVDDVDKLDRAIRELRPGGGTALYDAIYLACQGKLQQDEPKHKFRRAIVMLSDGDDNNSHRSRDQALEMAQKADVVIYAISTNHLRAENEGDKILRYFTAETGGRAFFPFKVEELELSFQDIASELRHQYNISYRPEPMVADGMFHPIELRVKGRKDIIIHARKGYYAPRM